MTTFQSCIDLGGPIFFLIAFSVFTLMFGFWLRLKEIGHKRELVAGLVASIAIAVWSASVTWHLYHHYFGWINRYLRFAGGLSALVAVILIADHFGKISRGLICVKQMEDEEALKDLAIEEDRAMIRDNIYLISTGEIPNDVGENFRKRFAISR